MELLAARRPRSRCTTMSLGKDLAQRRQQDETEKQLVAVHVHAPHLHIGVKMRGAGDRRRAMMVQCETTAVQCAEEAENCEVVVLLQPTFARAFHLPPFAFVFALPLLATRLVKRELHQ